MNRITASTPIFQSKSNSIMRNSFHSKGPELDFASQLKDYRQQLKKEYSDTFLTKIRIALLIAQKKRDIKNSEEHKRKNYLIT